MERTDNFDKPTISIVCVYPTMNAEELQKKAIFIRRDVVEICVANGAGHIAPSLSCIDILVALYYSIMNRSSDPQWKLRDRMVFSKAHGCYGVYSILADIGYIDKNEWRNFYKGSSLSGCIERRPEFGIEASCGALGHGLPMATGIAFGAKLQEKSFRIYCIVGDGEMQEGSNWEALQFAVKHLLGNLTVIIDANGLQAMDFLCNILSSNDFIGELSRRSEAFGCIVERCNGHDPMEIVSKLNNWAKDKEIKLPQVLIARTTKGHGLSCMENVPKFHFRIPTKEEVNMENKSHE
jgi:transketolase